MRRTLKSSKAPSSRPTRRYTVTPAMQEDRMLRDAVRRAEESARDRREEMLAPEKRRRESQALKESVLKEKERRRKYEEDKKIMQQQKEEQDERNRRIQALRAYERAMRRERQQSFFRDRTIKNKIKPEVAALTNHFRERLQRIQKSSAKPASVSSSSSDEFLDALPPDSPNAVEDLLGRIQRTLGSGKRKRNRRRSKPGKTKQKKTHRKSRVRRKLTRRH